MNDSAKKAMIVFGGGAVLFLLLKYVFRVKEEGSSKLTTTSPESRKQKQDSVVLLKAFTDAVKDGQPASFLNQMNAEFVNTYKMKVYRSKSSGKFFVADLEGKVILEQ
jgi:hypothetical protein